MGVEQREHMDTGREASHTGVCQVEIGVGQCGMGSWGEIAWGEMPDIGDGEEGSKSHCPMCTYATILHAIKKKKSEEN